MNLKRLVQVVEDLKGDLEAGLVAADIWVKNDAQSLAGFNSQPKAIAFFNEVSRYLIKALAGAEFPRLGKYYLINLENNLIVVVVFFGDLQLGMLVDLSKSTLGMIISVALPKALAGLEEALG